MQLDQCGVTVGCLGVAERRKVVQMQKGGPAGTTSTGDKIICIGLFPDTTYVNMYCYC